MENTTQYYLHRKNTLQKLLESFSQRGDAFGRGAVALLQDVYLKVDRKITERTELFAVTDSRSPFFNWWKRFWVIGYRIWWWWLFCVMCYIYFLWCYISWLQIQHNNYNPNHLDYENVHFDHNSALVCMELFLDQDLVLWKAKSWLHLGDKSVLGCIQESQLGSWEYILQDCTCGSWECTWIVIVHWETRSTLRC